MTNSYPRNDRRKARRRLFIATAAVLLAFFFDAVSGGALRGAARAVSSSAWKAGSAAGGAIFSSGFFSSKRAILAENEALKRELAMRDSLAGRMEALEKENEELRALARLAQSRGGVAAPVVSSTRSSLYGTFLIGAGAENGISVGDIVLAGERGFVLGRVVDVRKHSSLVKDIFAPGGSLEAAASGATFLLEGRGGGNARAEVPSALQIGKGDVVMSPAFGGRSVGIVSATSSDPSSALKRVYVRAPVNLSDLRFVYVVSDAE